MKTIDPTTRKALADQVRQHCTLPEREDGSFHRDDTVAAVADWIEHPPTWLTRTIPTPGRIVLYALNEGDADQINRRIQDAEQHMAEHRAAANGSVVQIGNRVYPGDVVPVVVTRAWGGDANLINGQALLDGNATYWITSRGEGPGVGQWEWPKRGE